MIKWLKKLFNPDEWTSVYKDEAIRNVIYYDENGYPYNHTVCSYYNIEYSPVKNDYRLLVSGFRPFGHEKYAIAERKYKKLKESLNK